MGKGMVSGAGRLNEQPDKCVGRKTEGLIQAEGTRVRRGTDGNSETESGRGRQNYNRQERQ